RDGHSVGLKLLPGCHKIAWAGVRGIDVAFHLVHQLSQRTPYELAKCLAVAVSKRFTGNFLGEPGCQAVMVVKARVVVPHRSQIDQPVQRSWDLGESAAAKVAGRL